MRKFITIACLLLALLVIGNQFVAHPEAQRAALSYILDGTRATVADRLVTRNSFTALTATGQTASFTASAIYHTTHVVVTGSPATCTLRLQGSVNGTTWYDISGSDITCTSTAVAFESSAKPAVFVRGNLTALTGGTSPTVTVHYAGR